VAKLDHTFLMSVPPQEAKAQFQADIGPELRSNGSLRLAQDESRRLVYSDGVVSREPAPLGESAYDWNTYAKLRRLLARRIKVEFAPDGAGTRVSLRGKAERDICAALNLLGALGQWPENREQRYERREADG
jgi:hypothetical protein